LEPGKILPRKSWTPNQHESEFCQAARRTSVFGDKADKAFREPLARRCIKSLSDARLGLMAVTKEVPHAIV
jgi:hypothetical protein